MSSWMNFSDAEEQTNGDVIPHGTLAKVILKVRPGSYNDESKGWTGGHATRSDKTGAVYLDCEFTVMGGKYNKRKIWSLIGLESSKGPKWGQMGRSFIRAALESAAGVKPEDASDKAMAARQINGLGDLNGLQFCVKIDVEEAEAGSGYDDKNKINNVIGVSHKEYHSLMSGAGTTQTDSAASSQLGQQAASEGGTPSWAS